MYRLAQNSSKMRSIDHFKLGIHESGKGASWINREGQIDRRHLKEKSLFLPAGQSRSEIEPRIRNVER